MSARHVQGLKCRECGRHYELRPVHVCEVCFGPLEVGFDYEQIAKDISREKIAARERNLWRYMEFLPLEQELGASLHIGFTPLIRAERLGRRLGLRELWIKNDAASFPTLSYKDRVVAVALSKAREFGFKTVACATMGNLGNAVAAQSVIAGLECFIFMPANLELGKLVGASIYGVNVVGISGAYENVNRLCSELAGKYRWGFVNINLRPFYAEGAKTLGFEIIEQLGWRAPDNVVAPMAGGSLLVKIDKAIQEFKRVGLIDPKSHTRLYGAQASGCNPITHAIKQGWELFRPVKPNTIAKSLSIGNPADGFYAIKTIRNSGGYGEDVSDEELVEGVKMLSETEGIFTESAGGAAVAVTRKLLAQGRLDKDGCTVLCITANGLKTMDVVLERIARPDVVEAKLGDFEQLVENLRRRADTSTPAKS